MEYWPFMLIVGTRDAMTGKEEYRGTFLLRPVPQKGTVLCRHVNGEIQKEFVKEHFARRPVFKDYNELALSLRRHWWMKRLSYVVQIEHFPDESFPK